MRAAVGINLTAAAPGFFFEALCGPGPPGFTDRGGRAGGNGSYLYCTRYSDNTRKIYKDYVYIGGGPD